MAYIYKFINDKEQTVYIGKTTDFPGRIKQHFSSNGHLNDECYIETKKVLYCELPEWDADYLEKRLINDLKPKYNQHYKDNVAKLNFRFDIPKLIFEEMSFNDFINLYIRKNKRMLKERDKTINKLKRENEILKNSKGFEKYNKIKLELIFSSGLFDKEEKKEIYEILPVKSNFDKLIELLDLREKRFRFQYDCWFNTDADVFMELEHLPPLIQKVTCSEDSLDVHVGDGMIGIKYDIIKEIEWYLGEITICAPRFRLSIW